MLLALCLALVLTPSPARAEATAQERALSESLFQEGKKLLDEGRAVEACPKLAESQRLDPGGGTQLLLGLCWEQAGRYASAWVELNEALSLATRDGRESRISIAREHIAAIEPRLSRVELKLAEGADVEGLTISRNGSVIPRAAWSIATPFDEGEHEFEVAAPGYVTKKVIVNVAGEGVVVPLEIPVLDKAPPSEEPVSTESGAGSSDSDAPAQEKGFSKQSVVGWALVGGAVVASGIGGYFGLRAMSLSKGTKEACPTDVCERPDLEDDYDKAGTAAKNANIAFISAGVLVTAGVVTLLTNRPQSTATDTRRMHVALSPRWAGAQLQVQGGF